MMERFSLIAGPCAIEDYNTGLRIAKEVKALCEELEIDYIFKASYRKANRTRLDSFQGIGDRPALEVLQAIGRHAGVPVLTDVHESHEPAEVAEYVDALQIPAFLCRQTRLLLAAGATGLPVNVKKGQFLSPEAMKFVLEKVTSTGNMAVWACERGTSFGYHDLIVDATAIQRLKQHGCPVIMDCTHSVQKPNRSEGVTGGDPDLIETVCLAAVATGADGLFFEVHPQPETAASDPHTMLQLDRLAPILRKAIRIRKALEER